MEGGARKRLQFSLTALCIFVVSYVLNAATPFIADDYTFAYIFGTPTRVTSIGDILHSQSIFYATRNGRVIGGFFEQLAVFMGKPAFNVVNALVFLALVGVIYLNANGLRRPRVALFAAIPLGLWFALPSFGQSALFAAGATNYVWLATIALAALVPFRIHAEDATSVPDALWLALGMFILGVLAGWTNENLGPTVALLMIAFLVLYRRDRVRIPRWAYTGAAGAIIGAVLLVGAPGNYRTLAEVGSVGAKPSIPVLVERLAAITHAVFLDNLFAVTAIFLVLLVLVREYPGEGAPGAARIGMLYLGAAFVATYAMVLSPFFPPRAWTGILVLAMAGAGVVFSALDTERLVVRRLVSVVLACALIAFAVKFAYVYVTDIRVTNRLWHERIAYIEQQRSLGRVDLKVAPIVATTAFNGAYDIKDLDPDPAQWPNADVARYFGIHSIRIEAGER